ncbi:hypothetical protein [Nocardia vermiculata]|uniref:DUF2867 domain-containing protein n=1 Tax=Nocardia vermiculata TaxID=257274 RepID=A0A846Y7I0_9NOCA|nr:hypothetical protein [Nocardia vermiculata]NKY53681.1 DUF2867 domain-containing protein [Nocardia vermiculata]
MSALAEDFLSTATYVERHSTVIPAPPQAVWAAWQGMSIADPPLIAKLLIGVRDVIARVRHGHTHRDLPQMFIPLAEEPPHQLVEGLVGRWWQFGAHANRADIAAADFRDFSEPGYGKATIDLCFEELPDGRTRATTSTRVGFTDDKARRAMRPYWILIRPFSGLIRRAMLRRLRQRTLRLVQKNGTGR